MKSARWEWCVAGALIVAVISLASAAEHVRSSDQQTLAALQAFRWEGLWSSNCANPLSNQEQIIHQVGKPTVTYRVAGMVSYVDTVEQANYVSARGELTLQTSEETAEVTNRRVLILRKIGVGRVVEWSSIEQVTAKQDLPPRMITPEGLKRGETATRLRSIRVG